MDDTKEVRQPAGLPVREAGSGISVGRVVTQIGDRERMTVEEITTTGVTCVWFRGIQFMRGEFAIGALRLAPPLPMPDNPRTPGDVASDSMVEAIAIICHEANRTYCTVVMNDPSQKEWNDAEMWQRESARKGVRVALMGATAEQLHEAWMQEKLLNGWTYGEVKDATARTHPCLVPYAKLPELQRRKDYLFGAIVRALSVDI